MTFIEQVQTTVSNDVLSILRENAVRNGIETLVREDMTRTFLHVAQLRTEGETVITVSCHCESTAVLAFHQKNVNSI